MKVKLTNGIDRRTEEHTEGLYSMKDVRTQGNDIHIAPELTSSAEIFDKKPFIVNETTTVPNPFFVATWGNIRMFSALKSVHGTYISSHRPVNNAPFIIHLEPDSITQGIDIADINGTVAISTSGYTIGHPDNPTGIKANSVVPYLLVPRNKLGEAGAWAYASQQSGNNTGFWYTNLLTIPTNTDCVSVDIYRTRELTKDETVTFNPYGLAGAKTNNFADFTFHFLGRITKIEETSNTLTFEDHEPWRAITDTDFPNGTEQVIDGAIFTENINYLIKGLAQGYTNFGAKTIRDDAGRVLYGNVKLRTKKPQILSTVFADGNEGYTIKLQYEYKIGENSFYGPVTQINDITSIRVPYEGASVLHIWVHNTTTGVYQHFKELSTPDSRGFYIEDKHFYSSAHCTFSWSTLHPLAIPAGASITTFTPDSFLEYPFQVFMSEPFKPREITSAPVQLGLDEEIHLLSTARVEETDQRSFDFYIFTNRAVYYAQRIGADISIIPIQTTYGIATDSSDFPIYTKTDFGLAFYTTSNRLVLLDARRIKEIDEFVTGPQVNSPLWTTVGSMGYHSKDNQLWVSTDTGLWCFDMNSGKWSGNYDILSKYTSDALEFGIDDNTVYVNSSGLKEIPDIQILDTLDADTILNQTPVVYTSILSDEDHLVYLNNITVDYEQLASNPDADVTITNVTSNLDIEQTPDVSFSPQPRRTYYPRIRGRKLAISVGSFQKLRDINIDLTPN